jgi:hypothetical protein
MNARSAVSCNTPSVAVMTRRKPLNAVSIDPSDILKAIAGQS